jgi:3-oxoacyl-[acyl-carrier-protein] synthase II
MSDLNRRIVITGVGAISPLGLDMDTTWINLLAGKSGVRRINSFNTDDLNTKIAATVEGFDPMLYLEYKEARRTPRFAQFALAATMEALKNSGLALESEDLSRIGIDVGSALGGTDIIQEQQTILNDKGVRFITPSLIPSILINSAASLISIKLGIVGGVNAPVAACATGAVAIGDAYRRLQWGDADVIIAGGADSVISPLGVAGFSRLGACSTKNDTPEKACSPFDANRDGTVVAEGSAIVILETLEHAKSRGAKILAEIVGVGFSSDAYHLVIPDPAGLGAARAMQNAISKAGLLPPEMSWICAHGTGTKLNDLSETIAIKKVFADLAFSIPVSSMKGGLGHMIGATGAISVAIACKALGDGIIPPTINYVTPDPECDLDYVPNQPRKSHLEYVMVNSFGFGGQNACLVLKAFTTDRQVGSKPR